MSHTLTHTKVCGLLFLQQACVAAPDSTAKTSKLRCREEGVTMVQEPPEQCDPGSVAVSSSPHQVHTTVSVGDCFGKLVTASESFWFIRQAGHLNTCSERDRIRAQEQRQEWAWKQTTAHRGHYRSRVWTRPLRAAQALFSPALTSSGVWGPLLTSYC